MINRLHALFPPTIKDETPNPLTPWSISKELFERLRNAESSTGQPFRKAVVLSSDPEWRFVWTAFSHDLPNRYMIRSISCIHNGMLARFFEANLINQDQEASKCVASWQNEPNPELRAKVMERWEAAAKLFSPFTTMETDGRRHQWENVKVLPLWQGTEEEISESICESGFTHFGKSSSEPQTSNAGFFGSGIYFTNSARYAADIYSQGHLILSWVSMRTPFPVVSGDLKTLAGSTAYKHYNAHYAPVWSKNPSNPFEADYFPLKEGDVPHCDELVVFESAQVLPRFWVTLELLDLYKKRLSQEPQFVEDLMTHFYNLQLNSEVDSDRRVRLILATFLAKLIERDPLDDLTDEELQWYEVIRNLLNASGKVQRAVRDQLIVLSGGKPQSPDSSTRVAAPIQSAPSLPDYPPYLLFMAELEQERVFGEHKITPNPQFAQRMPFPNQGFASSTQEEIKSNRISQSPRGRFSSAETKPAVYREADEEAFRLPEIETTRVNVGLSLPFQSPSDTLCPSAPLLGFTPPRFLTHAEMAEEEYLLGLKYKCGNDVPRDYQRAFQHFKIAADAGYAPAQLNILQLLHLAASEGHKDVVELLLTNGAQVNVTDAQDKQPIYYAAESGHKEIVELLLAKGAKVDATYNSSKQLIHLAAEKGHKEVVELLLANGAKVDATYLVGRQPIHEAAMNGHMEVVELLLGKGAKVNAADEYSTQPIHLAARHGYKEVVELLLAKGAKVNAANRGGERPIYLAALRGHKKVVKLLLAKGAKVNAADEDGQQPIHLAASEGHKEVVELLLAKGAKVNAVNKSEQQPIHLAARNGHKEVVELLLAKGAKVDAANKDRRRPIHLAAEHGHKDIVELLRAKGAKFP